MVFVLDHPSPNHDARPDNGAIDILLLHYTGMESGEAALARLCDPAAKVSAHYLIEEDGRVLRLVPEHRRAWHAGLSSWQGASDINARSIGIELVNPGHEFGYRLFPDAQMTALIELGVCLITRNAIPRRRVIGHSDVAPLRKEDPGELFDWPRLAAAGLGLWPQGPLGSGAMGEADAKALLATIGYGYAEEDFVAVLTAFQRHFRPADISGALDEETAGLLRAVAAMTTVA